MRLIKVNAIDGLSGGWPGFLGLVIFFVKGAER
jgi:hypothetical protein